MEVLRLIAKVAFGISCLLVLDMVRRGIIEPRKFQEGSGFLFAGILGTAVVGMVAFG